MGLFDGLTQQLSGQVLSSIASQLGADEGVTQTAIQTALPLLFSALSKNASTEGGATSLSNAIDKDHDGSILESLMDFIPNATPGSGAGILSHLLGNKTDLATQGISQSSGLSSGQVGQLLITLAPIILGYLGKQKQQSGLDASGLADLLGGEREVAQNSAPGGLGMLANLLDMNHDGSPVDDVLGMLGRFMK